MGLKITIVKKGKSKHKKTNAGAQPVKIDSQPTKTDTHTIKADTQSTSLVVALKAASLAHTKAVLLELLKDAKGNIEASKYLEAAYQQLLAGGGTEGGNVNQGVGSDPEATSAG